MAQACDDRPRLRRRLAGRAPDRITPTSPAPVRPRLGGTRTASRLTTRSLGRRRGRAPRRRLGGLGARALARPRGGGAASTSWTSRSARTSRSTAPGSRRSLEQDAYAGLLVSMHGAGIYRGRYGTQPSPRADLRGRGAASRSTPSSPSRRQLRSASSPGSACPRRSAGRTIDCCSSTTGCRSTSACATWRAGEPNARARPARLPGMRGAVALEPSGSWRVRVDPYPLAESPADAPAAYGACSRSGHGRDGESFRREFSAAVAEDVDDHVRALDRRDVRHRDILTP